MHYRPKSFFKNWILLFVKWNTSHISCHSFLVIRLWAPKVCKNQAWVLDNLRNKLDRKYQLHHVTSSCFTCFQFLWEKIFFFCTSEMAIKCAFLQLQSCNLVQMKANKILFILAFFSMPYDTRFKSYDHLTGSPHFMQKWNILNWQLPPLEFRKHQPV